MRAPQSTGIGIALVLLSISSVQWGAAVGKSLFPAISPEGLTVLRLVIAAAIMLAIARPRVRSWDRSAWLWVLALGGSLAGMNLLYYVALAKIPLAVAVTCELIGPLVLSLALSRRLVEACWVLLACIGVLIIGVRAWGGDLDLGGVALALAAGGCWAAYIVCSKRVGGAVPGLGGLAAAMVIAAIIALPFGAAGAVVAVAADLSLLWPALLVALMSSVVAYGLEMLALRRIPPRVFGVLMSLEPAAAAGFGLLLLGEVLGWWEVAAIALVIAASAGIAFAAVRSARRSGPVTTDTGALPAVVQ